MCQFTELKTFNEVVKELIAANYQQDKITGCMLNTIWEDFSKSLSGKISRQDSNEKLSIFIRLVQNNLTEFADDLYKYYERNEFDELIRNLFARIIYDIIDKLDCYKNSYNEFFNLCNEVPVGLIMLNKKASLAHKKIIHSLTELHIDQKLIEILDLYIKRLYIFNSFEPLNWYQYGFLIGLCEKLILFIESASKDDQTVNLIKLLITRNFNTIDFYDYLVEKYNKRLTDPNLSYEEQELELLYLLRWAKTIMTQSDLGYDVKAPSISIAIDQNLNREIDLISRMKKVNTSNVLTPISNKTSNYYFNVTVTLEELFFLIKVMLEVRFIRTKFKSNLYSFVSKHIKTDRTTSPSERYMRNILAPNHHVPVKIIRKIRSWLMNMVTYIDTNYSDQLKLSLCLTLSVFKFVHTTCEIFS